MGARVNIMHVKVVSIEKDKIHGIPKRITNKEKDNNLNIRR
jgi:hypothetical protein